MSISEQALKSVFQDTALAKSVTAQSIQGRTKIIPLISTPYKKYSQVMKHSSLLVRFSKYLHSISVANCRFWG